MSCTPVSLPLDTCTRFVPFTSDTDTSDVPTSDARRIRHKKYQCCQCLTRAQGLLQAACTPGLSAFEVLSNQHELCMTPMSGGSRRLVASLVQSAAYLEIDPILPLVFSSLNALFMSFCTVSCVRGNKSAQLFARKEKTGDVRRMLNAR